ncbi:MAG: isoaspartyl peptidase/L-asparaginase [Candidatus Caldarchaeum sp.]|nr:isoaspartyl peptidase/L-asparaginase [Candidatus Caldarchaeum sp.]MDW7977281.1 isoaspartyl peptidase/L-asparaginase [Candidatus Caldarchaeum sp.]
MVAIVVHGGAINPLDEKFNKGVSEAVETGIDLLLKGGSAVEAATEAIRVMEDNPIFNAGTGSWLNLKGEVEMDAIIVDGFSNKTGAVAAIKKVKNPILVARKVMEETDHILLVGEGATEFARYFGFREYDPATEERRRGWQELREKLMKGEQTSLLAYWSKISKFAKLGDTVGAVALDKDGRIAAGTSSGGFPMKLPGRVGDVPIINASTYAGPRCGVSLTGHGEVIMQNIVARNVAQLVENGLDPQAALTEAFTSVLRSLPSKGSGVLLGGVSLDFRGRVGGVRNTELMPHAYAVDSRKVVLNFGTILRV